MTKSEELKQSVRDIFQVIYEAQVIAQNGALAARFVEENLPREGAHRGPITPDWATLFELIEGRLKTVLDNSSHLEIQIGRFAKQPLKEDA